MPAETHQHGRQTDAVSVADFLGALLDPGGHTPEKPFDAVTLADCGVSIGDLDWLWETVCEDLAERSLVPELEMAALDPSMTLREAANVMAETLSTGGDDDG